MKAESKIFIRVPSPKNREECGDKGDKYFDIDTGNCFTVIINFERRAEIDFVVGDQSCFLGEYSSMDKANVILNELIDDIGYIYSMKYYEEEYDVVRKSSGDDSGNDNGNNDNNDIPFKLGEKD